MGAALVVVVVVVVVVVGGGVVRDAPKATFWPKVLAFVKLVGISIVALTGCCDCKS